MWPPSLMGASTGFDRNGKRVGYMVFLPEEVTRTGRAPHLCGLLLELLARATLCIHPTSSQLPRTTVRCPRVANPRAPVRRSNSRSWSYARLREYCRKSLDTGKRRSEAAGE